MAASPDSPKRLFLRISGLGFTTESTPEEQLFRSNDDGRTWRRIGYAWGPIQKARSKSTLPWNFGGRAYEMHYVGPGGCLYVVAAKHIGSPFDPTGRTEYLGLYCSADYGKTFTRGC